ncbi:hypothetical protein CTheo_2601 [Ceratobasidium theobromae]|uniref:Uncharacterized protein n=1 Tax=Ceratobasidium theobromae TaxID=1582974 RepID=A0A5N5QQH2_9AGAM|nr:hypothetical protein CTheo_2601 [Ceratobasidium theobromae]
MAERMPLAYPNVGSNQINFSLPLRLAHHRSTSSLSSCPQLVLATPSQSARGRSASVPNIHTLEAGPLECSSSKPNTNDSHSRSSPNRQVPPQLHINDRPRVRTDSASTASSLEASLVELEELIEVLGTPAPYIEAFSITKPEPESDRMPAELLWVDPGSPRRFIQPGPTWI